MARPTKVKEAKPKALEGIDGDGGSSKASGGGGLNMIIMAVIIVIGSAVSSAASVYFLAPMVMKPMLAQISAKGDGDGAAGDAPAKPAEPVETVGPVLELDEFTVNLKDPGGERYLRATVSVTVTADDPKFDKLSGEAAKKWDEDFKGEMSHYVPAIRDIVVSTLTKQYSSTLSTAQGKEAVRDEIKREVDGLLQGKHKVIRVNLENFVIQ